MVLLIPAAKVSVAHQLHDVYRREVSCYIGSIRKHEALLDLPSFDLGDLCTVVGIAVKVHYVDLHPHRLLIVPYSCSIPPNRPDRPHL